MTTPELIAELERLDAAATKGPWPEAYVSGAIRHIVRNVDTDSFLAVGVWPDMQSQGFYGWDRNNDAPLIAFSGTHRGAILAKLRRLERAEGLLLQAGSAIHPATTLNQSAIDRQTFERIDAFIREVEA